MSVGIFACHGVAIFVERKALFVGAHLRVEVVSWDKEVQQGQWFELQVVKPYVICQSISYTTDLTSVILFYVNEGSIPTRFSDFRIFHNFKSSQVISSKVHS